MELKKIYYKSAVFFGAFALVTYLLLGVLQWSLKDVLLTQGIRVDAMATFVYAPLIGGVVGYLIAMVFVAIYNFVAQKYPISWEIGKK